MSEREIEQLQRANGDLFSSLRNGRHIHESSCNRLWLPSQSGTLQPHPCCKYCGAVKNISSDRARGMGYYTNILSELAIYLKRKGKKITKAQIRLIIKELEKIDGFDDTYVMFGTVQRSLFVDTVRRYTGLSRSLIESFL